MEKAAKKIPAGIFLLRKSRRDGETPVFRDGDFPVRFQFGGKDYEISTTKAGKLIMT